MTDRGWKFIQSTFVQLIGLAGFVAFVEGVRQVYSPAAFIVGGGLVVGWTILKVRSFP